MAKGLLVLGGTALVATLGWTALSYRPFAPAPPPPPGARAAATPATVNVHAPEGPSLLRRFRVKRHATPPLEQTTNILLAGIDTRPDHAGGRTDALIVLVIDDSSRHVGLISIPRDLLVNIPWHNDVRINTVYLRGARDGGSDHGRQLLNETVEQLLGLPIAHTVFVDHAGFEKLIDTVGGLDVEVACPIRDRFIDPRGPGGRLELLLDAGIQHLDGRTALMFARSRHGRGIIDRARRQQALLAALRARLQQLGTRQLIDLLPLLRKTVFTDLRTLDILRLARRLARIKPERVHGLLLRGKHAQPTVLPDKRWVMIPKPDAIHAAVAKLFDAGPPGVRATRRRCPPLDAAFQRRHAAATRHHAR